MSTTKPLAPYTPSAMKETRDFHPTDLELRRMGWRIHSRPEDGEPVWERHGKQVPQSQIKEEQQSKS